MYDTKNLSKMSKLGELAPEPFKAYALFDAAAFRDGGAITVKNKALIAIAVACTTQCPYCIEVHSKRAVAAGASQEEIAEAALVAAAIRAGGAVTHATHAVK